MSQQAIRGALQTQLLTLGWADQTALENETFEPATDVPHQAVNTLFAEPNSYAVGASFQEQGVFQVRLFYPTGTGAGDSTARAELIRAAFAKNTRLPASGPMVAKVMRAPEITRLGPAGIWDVTVVRIRFSDR